MNLKLLFLFAFLSLPGFSLFSVHSQNAINFRFIGGTEKNITLDDLSKITFYGTNLVMNYSNLSNEAFEISSISKIVFSLTNNINSIQETKTKLYIYPGRVTDFFTVENLPVNAIIAKIYRIDGTPVQQIQLSKDLRQVDVSFLSKGFYLLKIDNQTVKFIKQ